MTDFRANVDESRTLAALRDTLLPKLIIALGRRQEFVGLNQ